MRLLARVTPTYAKPNLIDFPDPEYKTPAVPSNNKETVPRLAMPLVGVGGRYIREIRANRQVVEARLSLLTPLLSFVFGGPALSPSSFFLSYRFQSLLCIRALLSSAAPSLLSFFTPQPRRRRARTRHACLSIHGYVFHCCRRSPRSPVRVDGQHARPEPLSYGGIP